MRRNIKYYEMAKTGWISAGEFSTLHPHMKKSASKITLILSAMALAGAFFVPAVSAQDDAAAKKAKRDAANLKKYDKNGNGKLDEDEIAQMKKDQAEAKAKKEAEKNKK